MIGCDRDEVEGLLETYREALGRRGPDGMKMMVVKISSSFWLGMLCSVLWVRGEHMMSQPVERGGDVMGWNGELYGIEWKNSAEELSDTAILMNRLQQTLHIGAEIESLDGPFSLAFWKEAEGRLYFARNRFGQRSLLISLPQTLPGTVASYEPDHAIGHGQIQLDGRGRCIVLTSVVPGIHQTTEQSWLEVPVCGVFALDSRDPSGNISLSLVHSYLRMGEIRIPSPEGNAAECVRNLLHSSVRKRTESLGVHLGRVTVLFSGGIDCTLVVCLLHAHLPAHVEIVLKNVAFGESDEPDDSFDRLQARRSFAELQALYPGRKFRLSERLVGWAELDVVVPMVEELTFPHTTLMDVTIGSVLWFAYEDRGDFEKVVFTGIGADELFGGYARHRTRWLGVGKDFDALGRELRNDVERIAYRNNGRDDRLCAHFGLEVRHPFLDVDLVRLVLGTDARELVDFSHENGGKIVLRNLCREMGLSETLCQGPKKAMQFGSNVNKIIKRNLGLKKMEGTAQMSDLMRKAE